MCTAPDWTWWNCYGPSTRPRRRWRQLHLLNLRELLTMRAWPAFSACDNTTKLDLLTRSGLARRGTDGPGRTPSKAFSATC